MNAFLQIFTRSPVVYKQQPAACATVTIIPSDLQE